MRYEYPAPGHSEVKLYYKYGGSHFGTMIDTNRYARMYRSDKLECVVNQSIWMEGETQFADLILPACTNFERWDISEFANCGGYIQHAFTQCNHRVMVMQHKCIEPLGRVALRPPDLPGHRHAPRPGVHVLRGRHRAGLVQAPVRRHRPAAAHRLEGVPEEGLLRGAGAAGGAPRPGVVPLVRRGPAEGHAGAHAAAGRLHRRLRLRAADAVGQAGVRGVEPQALRARTTRSARRS